MILGPRLGFGAIREQAGQVDTEVRIQDNDQTREKKMRSVRLFWLSGFAMLWAFGLAGTTIAPGKPKSPRRTTPRKQVSPERSSPQKLVPGAPWHVKQADIRFPLQVQDTWHFPCDAYLADLKAIESDGLTFDPISKNSIRGKSGDGGSKGASAVYAVGPNHRWLTFSHRGGSSRVLADGKQIYTGAVWSRQTNRAKVAIPKGTSQIRIKSSGTVLNQAGLTLGPRAARAQVCLAGMNPADFKPLVYTSSGKRVGCDLVWASDGEPMTVLFDCSSGEKDYFLYPVDKRHNVTPLPWKRGGGMILETRYFDKYNTSVETFEGFKGLWSQADRFAGRMLVRRPFITSLPPFAPMQSNRSMFNTPHGAPLVLSRCSGLVRIPDSGKVRIYSRFRSGGYMLIDGKLFINAGGKTNREDIPSDKRLNPKETDGKEIYLSRGRHLIELCQYGPHSEQYAGFSFYGSQWAKRGARIPLYFEHVNTIVHAVEWRDKSKLKVSAVWSSITDGSDFLQTLGRWPAGNMMQWPLEAHLSKPMQDVIFRWKFPDGHEAVGRQIQHTFFEKGIYLVTIEALRSGDRTVLAGTTMRIKVDVNWTKGSRGYRPFDDELTQRANEFENSMPINRLLNIHALAHLNHRRPMQKLTGEAVGKRIDEVLKGWASDPSYLFWLGEAMSVPPASQHDAAMKLLGAAYRAFEPGTIENKQAALAMCDLLTTVYDTPSKAIELLEHAGSQKDTIALGANWAVASDKAFYFEPRNINTKEVAKKLEWKEFGELEYNSDRDGINELVWLRKRFDLDQRDNSRPLYLSLGRMYSDGMIFFNNQPLCEPWRCAGGTVAVPAKLLRPKENELLIIFQPLNPDYKEARYFLRGPSKESMGRKFMLAKAESLLVMDKTGEATKLMKQAILKKELAQSMPKSAVVGWYMLGPFEGNSATGAKRLPIVGVKNIDLKEPVNGKQWQKVDERFYQGTLVDLKSLAPVDSSLLFYKSFHAPKPFDSEFEGGGGKPFFFWLNGTHILGNIGRRGRAVSSRIATINAGTNEVLALVKVANPRYSQSFRLFMTNPESEITEMSRASQLRKAKLWANDGDPDHADAAFEFLKERLNEQPPLRTNVDVMETMVRALVGRQDYRRALVLSKRLLRMGVPEIYERALLLGQIQSMLGLSNIDEAREVYKQMNERFPYSEETLKARETIIKWVMDKNKKEKTKKD
jgi:hypothetical protein